MRTVEQIWQERPRLKSYSGYLRPYIEMAVSLESQGKSRREIAKAISDAGCVSVGVQWQIDRGEKVAYDNIACIAAMLGVILGPAQIRKNDIRPTPRRARLIKLFRIRQQKQEWTPEKQFLEIETELQHTGASL